MSYVPVAAIVLALLVIATTSLWFLGGAGFIIWISIAPRLSQPRSAAAPFRGPRCVTRRTTA